MKHVSTRDAWSEADALFAAALGMDAHAREALLRRETAGRPELRREVEDLVEASEAAEACFERLPGAIGATLDECISARTGLTSDDDAGPDEQVGRRIGRYRVVRRLARGGMGTVYLAERADGAFERRVALKLLRRGLDTDDILDRFRAERQILADLEHPNIARLIDGGSSEDGRPYLVMEYVEGVPLTDYCSANDLDIEARLRLFVEICEAVHHAHGHGVIHRDLKPANIFVDGNGRVKLLDFGIARLLDPDARAAHTRPGVRLLTPDYASPEQVCGGDVDCRSDVYQLGLLLYEMLSGALPYRVANRTDTELERVVCREPVAPPSTRSAAPLARRLRGDLDGIALQALRKDPSHRYASADALAIDVRRHLEGRPVVARAGARGYRLRFHARRHRVKLGLAAAVGFALLAAGSLTGGGPPPAAAPASGAMSGASSFGAVDRSARWIAIERIGHENDDATSSIAAQVTELLLTNLARVDEVQVVRLPGAEEKVGTLRMAALQAGATDVIGGVLHGLPSGELELALRRVDATSGRTLDTVRVRGEDGFALADRASAALLTQLGLRAPGFSVTAVTTQESTAYRFYVEGLTALRTGDYRVADRFFQAALEADSTFAMAAFQASRTAFHYDRHLGMQLLNRANRLATTASDRDRLVIRARWAAGMDDPSLRIFADSLVKRFPAESEGPYLLGIDLIHAGRFLEAIPHLERVVVLDSLNLHAPRAPCVACDALASIAAAYRAADSMTAAVRAGERWTRLQPGSARAWHNLASSLLAAERYDAALEARSRAAALRGGSHSDLLFPGIVALHRGDFGEADRLFRLHMRAGPESMRRVAAHWLAISLRTQGRWNEALEAADVFFDASRPAEPNGWWDVPGRATRALGLLGSGRAGEAARLFEGNVRSYPEYTASRMARDNAWNLTHAATAHVASGDTAALASLAERIETLGARSIYARDQRLHHYVRALLARARGAPEPEIEGHLRAALYSLPRGFSRINLELAESLLRQERHAEAAAVAGAAMRSSSQAEGMYATRTDFHELLGRIWHAAGEPDSAVVHLRAARNAWRAADPVMHPRVANIEGLLASLE